MAQSDSPLLVVMNWHSADCGPPVTDNARDSYVGYFRSDCNDQLLFQYHRESGEATVRTGDAGWERKYVVKRGRAIGLVLGYQERMWLRACWEAATAFSGHGTKMYPRPARSEGYRSACAELRASKGLTQSDVALLADISVRTLRRMERLALDDLGIVAGYSQASASAVATAYGVAVTDLFTTGQPSDEPPALDSDLADQLLAAMRDASSAEEKLALLHEFGQQHPEEMADLVEGAANVFGQMGFGLLQTGEEDADW